MLQSFSNHAPSTDIVAALIRDGGAIVKDQTQLGVISNIKKELRPHFDEQGAKFQNDFNGYSTLRLGGILGLSKTSAELIAHPRVIEIADAILRPYCECYRIGSCTAIEIHPGEKAQSLHRDDDFYPIRIPNVEFQISAMWALDDFTLENGATQVVVGSHDSNPGNDRDNTEYVAGHENTESTDDNNVVQAVMPQGSVLFYLGSTIHGGGANHSQAPRNGLINTYSLGWLRQEENHYLTIPRNVADEFPEHVRRLMGYQTHGPYLGVYPDDPDGHWFGS